MTGPDVGAGLVGRVVERQVTIDAGLVSGFADLVDDHNPLHVDPVAAAAGRFGRPIAHGMLVGSLFSAILATELPGPGTIYLSQTLAFRRPVPVGAQVLVRVEYAAVDAGTGRATLATTVLDGDGAVCLSGEAVVLLPPAGDGRPC